MITSPIADKIKNLFTLRLIYDMIYITEISEKEIESITLKLHELQYYIYLLDKELEENEHPDMESLERRWRDIFVYLERCGIPTDRHADYCAEILKYQKHELEVRQGKSLTKLDPGVFYTVKSCDVKLMRKILYFHFPSISQRVKEEEWCLFDYYAEIYDDVDDVLEDAGTNNGNLFLHTIQEKGLDATLHVYSGLLNDRTVKMNQMRNDEQSSGFISENTDLMHRKTTELLQNRIEQLQGLTIILGNMKVAENI